MREVVKTRVDFLKHLHEQNPEVPYRWFKAKLLAEIGLPDADEQSFLYFGSEHIAVKQFFVNNIKGDTPNKKAWSQQWELCRAYGDYIYNPIESVELEKVICDEPPQPELKVDLIAPQQTLAEVEAPSAEIEAPLVEPVELKVGDRVAHSDPYFVAYTYHGRIEAINSVGIWVRWQERRGKPMECGIYEAHELRHLENSI